MNILYIAFKDFSKLHFGASKKVVSECRAFERLGHNVTLIGREFSNIVSISTDGRTHLLFEHKSCPLPKLQPVYDKWHQVKDVIRYTMGKSYDLCYIRFDLCSHNFIKMLQHLRKISNRIIIEIPTYPYDKEYSGQINGLRLKIDAFYARRLKTYISHVVSFYPIAGGSFYEIPVINVPNGFDFDDVKLVSDDNVPRDIHIAAVSSMRFWHAYERFIEGLHLYYSTGGDAMIVLHLVGDGRECSKYRLLVDKYGLKEHVIFHGAMHGADLDELLNSCTLGIDSLGRHRTGISILSSLKSREYGAKGIPIINSCRVDIIDRECPYFLQVPADETPVDINSIVSFYKSCYRDGSRLKTATEVRSYIESRSDMNAVIESILTQIGNCDAEK